jgi:hypothetical protein
MFLDLKNASFSRNQVLNDVDEQLAANTPSKFVNATHCSGTT